MLVSPTGMMNLLKLPELQNPMTGLNFQGTGKLTTPLGAELLTCPTLNDDAVLALDRRYALEMVQSGDVSVEYDKLIDRQLERAAITTLCGFSKICGDAAKVLYIELRFRKRSCRRPNSSAATCRRRTTTAPRLWSTLSCPICAAVCAAT